MSGWGGTHRRNLCAQVFHLRSYNNQKSLELHTMPVADHVADALRSSREAAVSRPGQALSHVLTAISVVARHGSADEFRQASLLLDADTTVSGLHALTIRPLLDALDVAQTRREHWIAASLQRSLGWAYDFTGDDAAALEMNVKARTGFVGLGDIEGETRALNNLGVLWARRQDFLKASHDLDLAMHAADQSSHLDEQARVRVNLAYICEQQGDFGRGRHLLETAAQLSKNNLAVVQVGIFLNLVRIDLADNKARHAARTLLRAQPVIDAGSHFGKIEMWLLRGKIATAQRQYGEAERFLKIGIDMAKAVHAYREQAELWYALSAAREASGQYAEAFEARRCATVVEMSLRLAPSTDVQQGIVVKALIELF